MMYFTALGSLEPSPATLLPLVRPSVRRLRRRGGRALHGGAGHLNGVPKPQRPRTLRHVPCSPRASATTCATSGLRAAARQQMLAEPAWGIPTHTGDRGHAEPATV